MGASWSVVEATRVLPWAYSLPPKAHVVFEEVAVRRRDDGDLLCAAPAQLLQDRDRVAVATEVHAEQVREPSLVGRVGTDLGHENHAGVVGGELLGVGERPNAVAGADEVPRRAVGRRKATRSEHRSDYFVMERVVVCVVLSGGQYRDEPQAHEGVARRPPRSPCWR